MDPDGGAAPSHDLHVLSGHYHKDTMPTGQNMEKAQLESVLTSSMPPTGVPIVGAISSKTSSDGFTKYNTSWGKKEPISMLNNRILLVNFNLDCHTHTKNCLDASTLIIEADLFPLL